MSASQEVGEIFGVGTGPATTLLRSPTVIIAAIGLWGMNLYWFKVFKIDYKHALTNGVPNLGSGDTSDSAKRHRKNSVGSEGLMMDASDVDDLESSDDDMRIPNPLTIGGSSSNSSSPIKLPTKLGDGSSASPAVHRSHAASKHMTPLTPGTPGSMSKMKRSSSALSAGTAAALSPDKEHYEARSYDDFTPSRLITLSLALLALLHVTSFVWMYVLDGDAMGAIFAFYFCCTLGVVFPHSSNRWLRRGVQLVFQRVLELCHPRCYCCTSTPPRPVPFLDVFFADAMCSMSKVFFDWGMLWHLASHYPNPVPAGVQSIVLPSLCAAWPYLVRARQCLVMHTVGLAKNDPKRYQHILNAIKYSTSLFPIIVSAFQKTLVDQPALSAFTEQVLLLLLLVNSLYAFAWDVSMDWGMLTDPASLLKYTVTPQTCQTKCLRPRLRFGFTASVAILIVNFVLRFAWLLRFWDTELFPSVDEFVLCSQFLEVFRRALWNLLRVEWECIKIGATTTDGHGANANDEYDDGNKDNLISMVPLAPPLIVSSSGGLSSGSSMASGAMTMRQSA